MRVKGVRGRAGGIAGAGVILLILSGCANATAAVPIASPTASPAESTSTPSPSPTPIAVESEDPAPWIIDFGSVGPLSIGEDISDTAASMTGFTSTVYEGCPSVLSFEQPGFPTIVIPDRLGTGILEQIVLQGGADPSELAATSPETSAGIGIGSTLDELLAAYPDITIQEDPYTPHYALPDGSGNWINFSMLEDVVNNIVVRASPVVAKEYCG